MGGQRNTDWPVVGQSATTVLAHASNLKRDIQELLACSESSEGDATVTQPIPHHVFKCFSDSLLAFLDKTHDQPSLKDLAEAIERVSQTTKKILTDVQASKPVQGGPAAARAATTTVAAMEQPADLQGASPPIAAAMKDMPPEAAEKIMEARRRGQATLQSRAKVAGGGAVSEAAPSNVTARPIGLKATGITPKVGETSKLVLQSQNTEQGKYPSIPLSLYPSILLSLYISAALSAVRGLHNVIYIHKFHALSNQPFLRHVNIHVILGNVHEKIYTKLNSATREIRLVKLHPESDPDCDIRCELSTVSLNTRPIYKALSYTWGDANDTVPITLDGHRFAVTRNLKKALLRLRSLDTEAPIWIDAICINQVDTAERTQQVELMRAIYESTIEVIVWLGDVLPVEGDELWDDSCFSWHADESDVPRINSIMTFVEAYSDTFPEKVDPRSANPLILGFCLMRLLAGDVHPADIALFKNVNLRSLCMNGFGALVGQPWVRKTSFLNYYARSYVLSEQWNRIWVVQEVILPSAATLIYGRFSAPLRMYADASSNLKRHMSSCCASVITTTNRATTSIEKFCQKISEVVEAENLWSRKDNITLVTLFRLFFWRDATDDRDKVYGILSLVTDWGNGAAIAPDYTISPNELYQEVAIKSIQISGSLAILSYRSPLAYNSRRREIKNMEEGLRNAGKPSPEPVEIETPSWADLENQHGISYRKPTLEGIMRASLFDASAGKPAPRAPLRYTCSPKLTKTRVLTVSAVYVGTINSETSHSILVNTRQSIQASKIPLPAKPGDLLNEPYITGGNEYDALWRTLCADTFFQRGGGTGGADGGTALFRRATQGDVIAMQAWRRWIDRTSMAKPLPPPQDPSSSEEDALIADADRAIRSVCLLRHCIKTDTKYMGMVPCGAKSGDEVFVLLGSSTPFALHPLGEVAVEGLGDRRCYTVIGECYVHGIMDGELVKKPHAKVQELCLI
jgi:hypothetical protein